MYGAEEKWDLLLLFLDSSAWPCLGLANLCFAKSFSHLCTHSKFPSHQLPISSSQDEYILLCQPPLLPTIEGAQSDGAANSFRNPPFYDRLGRHSRGKKRRPRGAPTRGGKQDTQMFITTKQPTDRQREIQKEGRAKPDIEWTPRQNHIRCKVRLGRQKFPSTCFLHVSGINTELLEAFLVLLLWVNCMWISSLMVYWLNSDINKLCCTFPSLSSLCQCHVQVLVKILR